MTHLTSHIKHHTSHIRLLLSFVLCLLSLLLAPCSLFAASPTISSLPSVQNLQPTEATIVWTSANTSEIHGWVEYGTPALDTIHAFEQIDGQLTCFTNIYRVTLKNLQPGTTYYYRAFCRLIDSYTGYTTLNFGDTLKTDVFTFTTPTTEQTHVNAIIYSNIMGKTDSYASLLTKNDLSIDNYDLVLLNGNLITNVTGAKSLTSNLLKPVANLLHGHVPYYMGRGDAEYRNSFSRSLSQYFYTPGTSDSHPFYYSFTYGPCFFIMLDSGDSGEGANATYKMLNANEEYIQQQAAWLQQTLASNPCLAAKYIVVVRNHANEVLDNILASKSNITSILGTNQASAITLHADSQTITTHTYQ